MSKGILLRRRKLGLGSCRGIRDFSKTGLDFVRNDTMSDKDFEGVDMVFRWGCTSTVPIGNVVNNAQAIHLIGDKSRFRRLMQQDSSTHQITPSTAFESGHAAAMIREGHTLFIRPKHHAQGRNVHLASTTEEMFAAIRACGEGWYASKFYNKVAEYRVFVAQGRVVWVANKTPDNPDAPAWNVAQGGRFDNVRWDHWDQNVLKAAILAFNLTDLNFGGVDVMVDEHGSPYVIEINSAPSQTSPYRQECTAKAFDYIVENGKESIPLDENRTGWRHFIHPAIWSRQAES